MKWRVSSQGLSDAATALGLVSAVLISFLLWVGAAIGVLAAIAFILAIIFRRREHKRERSLVDSIARAMSVDRVLDVAARHVAIGGSGGGWRLSLYELNVADEVWVLRGRAASNELYADERDMPRVPHNQGVLRACLPGSHLPGGRFDEIPVLPSPDDPGWMATLNAWGITNADASSLRMKSRSYCGAVFKVGPQDGHQPTLGVVAESEAPDGVNIRTLETALTRPFFESIAELVMAARELHHLVPFEPLDMNHQ